MYNFINRMYQTKKADGTYIYSSADLDVLVSLKRITTEEAKEIRRFEQV